MIDQEQISVDWINKVSAENQNADKILTEKIIRALLLLEGLVKQNISFVFKGGTALMLHFNSAKRLSIDIDVIFPQAPDNLMSILNEVVKSQGFIRVELHHRKAQSAISKEHYKFYYLPHYKSNKEEDYVLLDVLYERVNYSNVLSLPIKSVFVPNLKNPFFVKVPSLEDILGDKLTAYAPSTTGIPYFKRDVSMSMEIIKQLYDIGNLFDVVKDLNSVRTTFHRFAATEIVYRNTTELSNNDVLEDIFQTSLCIATRGLEGEGSFDQLQFGIRRIKAFIFSENYTIERAIVHASKAAYLATLIRYNRDELQKYHDSLEMKNWNLQTPMKTKLNKLKKSNPEAFFYWYKIQMIILSDEE